MTYPAKFMLLDLGPASPALNMGLDEALLESAAQIGCPVLRFYAWTEPAASFGYFQKVADVEQATHWRPLVRRPTGGGLVSHQADWTYSLVCPPSDEWYGLRAQPSYERMHRWLQAAFGLLGVGTELAPDSRKVQPGQCFAGHERSDLLWQGRKIAGAAQRRARTGLLIQGSVQPPPPSIDRAAWQQAMCAAATNQWKAWWVPLLLPEPLVGRARELASKKYSQASYNRRC